MCGIAFCNSDKIDTQSITKKIINNTKHKDLTIRVFYILKIFLLGHAD